VNPIAATFLLPFRSGMHLNTQLLLNDGLENLASLLERTGAGEAERWRVPRVARSNRDLVFGADDREGSPLIPKWSLECDVAVPTPLAERMERDGVQLAVRNLNIVLFDFGVGVLIAHLDGVAEDVSSPAATLRAIELASDDFAALVMPTVAEVVGRVIERLERDDEARQLLLHGLAAGEPITARASEDGDLGVVPLWVHRLVGMRGDESALRDLQAVASLATELTVELRDAQEGSRVVPGTGSSVALVPLPAPPDEPVTIPRSVEVALLLLNAYWAGFSQYDQAIFTGISALHVVRRQGQSRQIRQQAEAVLELQERVLLFSAIVEHQGHHLAPDSQLVWESISRAWNLEPLFDGMMANVGTLDGLFRHVAESVRSDQADRLNLVVTVLTVASISTIGIDLLGLLSADPSTAHAGLRIGAIVVPLMVLALAWMLAKMDGTGSRWRPGAD
jgi:hypothetical protein